MVTRTSTRGETSTPDLDADADGPDGTGHAGVGGADFLLGSLRSIRFWTFFSAFFGLTGLALSGLGLVESAAVTLAIAVAMGATLGYSASAALRALASDTTGEAAESSDYVGKTARVLVRVAPGQTGKVRLQLKGHTVDVLATADDETFSPREEVMIIEMEGTTARLARAPDPRS